MKIKVLIVTNILSPYRIPLFEQLAERDELEVRVVALAESEANRQWGVERGQTQFRYQVLSGWHTYIWRWELPIHLNRGLRRIFRSYMPDVVICSGYDNLSYWASYLYARLARVPFILWCESTLLSTRFRKGLAGAAKQLIIRRADACVAFGEKSREFLLAFGASPERIFTGINTVDMLSFRDAASGQRQSPSYNTERARYKNVVLLFVGQLIPRKGLVQLLMALAELEDPGIELLVVGSGSQEMELREFCQSHDLRNIRFEGFHQPDDLPRYYALADVFVLPSFKEVWGLVVNEALASGLYVLCSDRAGAAYDVIKEGWNGVLFNPHNVGQLARLIQETNDNIDEIRARREAISKHACREFSIERSARAFLDAIRAVMRKGTGESC